MKHYETPVFIMKLYDDAFMNFVVKKDALLESEDLLETRRVALEYMPDAKFYILMEAEDLFTVTKETRELGASKDYSTHLAAIALCTDNFSMKLLGNLYMKINKPHTPTRLFENRQKAEEWLRSLMK